MHGLNAFRESHATPSSALVDNSSLIPSHSAPQQLFRTWHSSHTPTFAHLPRIILQLVNGYLSLKEIGAWCATSKDIYSTAAYFRCPVNTVQGGWRLRWLVIGKEFSWPRVRMLAYAAPRIQVTIVEATDPNGGLLTSTDQLELIRALPYLTELHAHYRFDRPLDWADQITTLVTRSDAHAAIAAYQSDALPTLVSAAASVEAASAAVRPIPLLRTTSTAPAPLPTFRSLMLCPHDALVDGGEVEDDDHADLFQAPSSISSSASSSAFSATSPKKKPAKKKPTNADEMKVEHEKALAEEQAHFDKWSVYNEKLFSKLHLFTTLEILGLNLTGNCSKWDVSGFKVLSNLHTIELDVETPQNFVFARQLTEIIEYVRDVPYRNLKKFQSNGLHYKHLQQLLRKRLPTDPIQEDPPCWQTLCHFRTYGDEAPGDVRVEADQWVAEQNAKYVLPFYGKKKPQPTEEEEKKAAASSSPATNTPNPESSSSSSAAISSSKDDNLDLNCDEILQLYSRLPKLRTLDLLGFRSTLTDDAYLTLPSFTDVDTLSVGGIHPELLSLMDGQMASDNCMPVMKQNFVDCMRKIAAKPVHVERLTFAYMRLTPQPTENEDGSPVWTASESSPTPLHDALFPFSAFLIELELHCIQGMTDVSAVVLCSKLESLRLVAAGGIDPKSITQLSVLKLRSLRLSNVFLPDDIVKQLQVPSTLMPSLVDFVCDTPNLDQLDINGDNEFAGLLNIPPEQLQQALGGLPPQMQWLGEWLQTQITQIQQHNNVQNPAAAAQPAPAPAPAAADNPLQFGSLYQQLYNSLFQGNADEDMPQLGEDEDDYYIPDEDEDGEGHGDYEDTVD